MERQQEGGICASEGWHEVAPPKNWLHIWKKLCEKYPIASIEDGLDEEDWEGWKHMTAELGEQSTASR